MTSHIFNMPTHNIMYMLIHIIYTCTGIYISFYDGVQKYIMCFFSEIKFYETK